MSNSVSLLLSPSLSIITPTSPSRDRTPASTATSPVCASAGTTFIKHPSIMTLTPDSKFDENHSSESEASAISPRRPSSPPPSTDLPAPEGSKNSLLRCQWADCGLLFATEQLLYQHLCQDHVKRRSKLPGKDHAGKFSNSSSGADLKAGAGSSSSRQMLKLECKWLDCNVTVMKRDHMTSHLRIHLNLKPYICDQCARSFKRPQDLKKHIRVHNSEKIGSIVSISTRSSNIAKRKALQASIQLITDVRQSNIPPDFNDDMVQRLTNIAPILDDVDSLQVDAGQTADLSPTALEEAENFLTQVTHSITAHQHQLSTQQQQHLLHYETGQISSRNQLFIASPYLEMGMIPPQEAQFNVHSTLDPSQLDESQQYMMSSDIALGDDATTLSETNQMIHPMSHETQNQSQPQSLQHFNALPYHQSESESEAQAQRDFYDGVSHGQVTHIPPHMIPTDSYWRRQQHQQLQHVEHSLDVAAQFLEVTSTLRGLIHNAIDPAHYYGVEHDSPDS